MDDDELTSLLRSALIGAVSFVNIAGTWVGAADAPETEPANDPAWRSDHPFRSPVPKTAQTCAPHTQNAQTPLRAAA